MMQRWKWKNILFIGLILLGVPGTSLFRSKYSLGLSEYEICSNRIVSDIRIVQLTDLHNSTFGDNNADLIALVQEQNPDLILITGDQLNSGEENTSIATNSISALCQIAPVYVSLGNHEVEYQQSYNTDIKALYEQAGATVLEREYVDTEVNGQQLRIGGIYGYCLPARYLETNEADPEECAFLSEFQDTDRYTVLLTHMPVCWLINDGINEWDIDCVFSGHVHGGEVILPFIGGMYAPDFGWFPGKLEGVYTSDDGTKNLVLSRELGTTEVIPRFNNIPEIVVVDLM